MAVMEKRRSIEVSGVKHVNPIPSASRRGPFVVSGAISGADPETGKVPAELDAQCRQMFDNVRRSMVAAGGGAEEIIKMSVWSADRKVGEMRDGAGVEQFRHPPLRPARHSIRH